MSDWIEHDGKGMPVDGDTLVTVKFRDGIESGCYHNASHFDDETKEGSNWVFAPEYGYPEDDIVAYKVSE